MEIKKYDIMVTAEDHHYPVPNNGVGHVPLSPPSPSFNRNPGEYPTILEPSNLPNGYGKVGAAMDIISAVLEIARHALILRDEIKNRQMVDLHNAVARITSDALHGAANEGDVSAFEWSVAFDQDGYAYYNEWEGGSIRDASAPAPNSVNLGTNSISRATLAKVTEGGRQAVRDYNTRKMIKDFSDKAKTWDSKGSIYDYKDVPAVNGGGMGGGGGGNNKNYKPTHIV